VREGLYIHSVPAGNSDLDVSHIRTQRSIVGMKPKVEGFCDEEVKVRYDECKND
jgi:hypothetical protein